MSRTYLRTMEVANRVLIVEGSLDQGQDFMKVDHVAPGTGRELARVSEVVERAVNAYRATLSELALTIEVFVKAKNRIAWQWHFRAIQTGSCTEFSASRRPMVWRGMINSEFRAGRISEEWGVTDLAEPWLLARK